MAKRRAWTDDELRAAIAASASFREAATKLGVERSVVERRVRALGIDRTHFRRWSRPTRWNEQELRAAVPASRSIAEVLRQLGLRAAGGNYDQVQRRIGELGLDTSHFSGSGWNRGLVFRPNTPTPLATVLVENRPTTSHRLKRRLIRDGLKPACCELCGWAQRASDGRLPLELDHINGDKHDNRLENLRVLCPNCHSLQPTHRGLNKRTRRR